MKILYLTTVLPSKRKTGSEIASQCFINALKQSGHEVLILGYQRKNDSFEKSFPEISVAERYIETDKAMLHPIFWILLSLLKNLPYSAAKYYSKLYLKKVKTFSTYGDFDIIIIDHAQLGWLENSINNKTKILLIEHNIEHEIYLTQSNNSHNKITKFIYKRASRLIEKLEKKIANVAKEVWTLTTKDSRYISSVKKEGKVRVFAVPSSLTTFPDRLPKIKNYDIGIIGTWTWKLNKLGLKWFFQAVYPHLPADLSIQVAGRGAEWLYGQYSNVEYCGFVPDAQAFMEQAKVIAIPSIRPIRKFYMPFAVLICRFIT